MKPCIATLAVGLAVVARAAAAQIAQGTAHLRERPGASRDSAATILRTLVFNYSRIAASVADSAPRDEPLATAVAQAAADALAALDRPNEYRPARERVDTALARYRRGCDPAHNRSCRQLSTQALAPLPPQVYAVAPGVVFGIGWSLTIGPHMTGVHSFGLSSNLLGAAAGGLTDALGVGGGGFKDYLAENVSVGTTLPTGGQARLTGFVQLGLGELRLQGRPVWPVVGVEQLDSADHRLPRTLLRADSTATRWTALQLAIGVSFLSESKLRERIAAGVPVPIVTLGISFPYYFPGDPFQSLAGIVSGKTKRYVHDGRVRFMIGVGMPLLKAGGR
jgi:hypothetical protein